MVSKLPPSLERVTSSQEHTSSKSTEDFPSRKEALLKKLGDLAGEDELTTQIAEHFALFFEHLHGQGGVANILDHGLDKATGAAGLAAYMKWFKRNTLSASKSASVVMVFI